jgi:hypothetical protein
VVRERLRGAGRGGCAGRANGERGEERRARLVRDRDDAPAGALDDVADGVHELGLVVLGAAVMETVAGRGGVTDQTDAACRRTKRRGEVCVTAGSG